ncbi:MAG TPA: hypothetical protein DHW82_06765 [Spirochaetia bacterium]|nr:MAG: hypothetical protein A2Y41_10820 [Spirochaetes bacterium GWB1_36_13]HCL56696.1 hypothetical protein [Spirochaetia bacterium]
MKKIFNLILIIGIIALLILLIVNYMTGNKTKLADPDKMTALEKLERDRDEIYAMHKKYIANLDSLKNKVKSIGTRLTGQIEKARFQKEKGDLFKENQLWEQAMKNYEIGLEIFPEDASLNYSLALCKANLGLIYPDKMKAYWADAEKLYLDAIRFDASYSLSHFGLAMLYLNYFEKNINRNKLPAALNYIDIYIANNPKMTNGYFARGRIFYLMKQKQAAIENYKMILSLSNEKSSEYVNAKKNIMQIQSEAE